MAYLIFADRKGEMARHALDAKAAPVTVGRSVECTIVVRDVLLSRRHCQFEPMLDRWVLTDIGSKNGTFLDNKRVDRRTLEDGDVIRIGRTSVCFRAGEFVPAPPSNRPADFRPVDPLEALAGTVAGFRVELEPKVDTSAFPRPQPKPAESRTLSSHEAAALVTGLSSSQWDDQITRGPGRQKRPLPTVSVTEDVPGRKRTFLRRANRRTLIGVAVFTILLLTALAVYTALSP